MCKAFFFISSFLPFIRSAFQNHKQATQKLINCLFNLLLLRSGHVITNAPNLFSIYLIFVQIYKQQIPNVVIKKKEKLIFWNFWLTNALVFKLLPILLTIFYLVMIIHMTMTKVDGHEYYLYEKWIFHIPDLHFHFKKTCLFDKSHQS